MPMSSIKSIDESKLENDIQYRFQYLTEFIGFNETDIKTITGAAELLAPIVPALVDAVYEKLFSYDCTKRHFAKKQHGFDGEVPDINSLGLEHEIIKFRKSHLTNYLVKLVSGPYDASMVNYLDTVGKIHTKNFGDTDLEVPLVQMNALMGFVADAVNKTIFSLNIPNEAKEQAIVSFSKLLWIQNDLITRHYQG